MPTSTYLATYATQALAQAQRVLDVHVLTLAGSCRACGTAKPCGPHLAAAETFTRYRRLPRRTPGASVASRR
jgi:hypothetical protein